MIDTRKEFNDSWLLESPELLSPLALFGSLEKNIKERIAFGSNIQPLGNNLFKIEGEQILYYWFEDFEKNIILAAEFGKKAQTLVINGLGKRTKGGKPFASDLYIAVLNDQNKAIRIISDTMLTDEGFAVWKKLLNLGCNISMYDSGNPGQTFKAITSEEDLKKYLSFSDKSYRQYQFVLSKDNEVLAEVASFFNTRRMRELSGML